MTKERKIIFLTDLIDTKIRKEKELEYYQQELEKLQTKMFYIKKEIDLTTTIIDVIGNETILDIREHIQKQLTVEDDDGN